MSSVERFNDVSAYFGKYVYLKRKKGRVLLMPFVQVLHTIQKKHFQTTPTVGVVSSICSFGFEIAVSYKDSSRSYVKKL